jgi:hypothetical protein
VKQSAKKLPKGNMRREAEPRLTEIAEHFTCGSPEPPPMSSELEVYQQEEDNKYFARKKRAIDWHQRRQASWRFNNLADYKVNRPFGDGGYDPVWLLLLRVESAKTIDKARCKTAQEALEFVLDRIDNWDTAAEEEE